MSPESLSSRPVDCFTAEAILGLKVLGSTVSQTMLSATPSSATRPTAKKLKNLSFVMPFTKD